MIKTTKLYEDDSMLSYSGIISSASSLGPSHKSVLPKKCKFQTSVYNIRT